MDINNLGRPICFLGMSLGLGSIILYFNLFFCLTDVALVEVVCVQRPDLFGRQDWQLARMTVVCSSRYPTCIQTHDNKKPTIIYYL